MNALIIAILLAQTQPTGPQARGAIIALYDAQADLANRTITSSAAHQACVSGPNGWTNAGTVTIRVGVVLLSAGLQTALGAVPLKDAQNNDRPWVYGAMEIQAVPQAGTGLPALPPWMRILDTDEVEVRVSPVWPTCQVAFIREGFANPPWRCACRGVGICNWTPPLIGGGFGASVPLPKDMTAPSGSWSGAGCVAKTCVQWAGDESMPEVCK
jgi:hypothetical protein